MDYDIVIRKGNIVKPEGTIDGDILISGKKIVGIIKDSSSIGGKRIINAAGYYVLPGVIDPHVHLTAGGPPNAHTFSANCRTETRSAVTGGVTTLFHFLRTSKSYFNVIEDYINEVKKNSLIDIGFHIMVMNESHIREIPRYVKELGINSFKFLMAYRGDPTTPLTGLDDGLLFEGFKQLSKSKKGLAIVHAENNDIVNRTVEEMRKLNRQDVRSWSDARPEFCEEEAIRRAIFLAEKAKTRLYIAHLSIGAGVYLVAERKLKNPIFVETAAHYLTLTKLIKPANATIGKVNPPLRTAEDNKQLWKGIQNGIIDTIGSDHCPYTLQSKGNDIWTASAGLPGIAMTLPILLSEGVNKKRITIEQIARVCSLNPAKLFGLFPRKGMIDIGFDADLVIVDLNKEVKIKQGILNSVSDYTPFDGYKIRGWPIITIASGRVINEYGKINDNVHRGEALIL
ncbi:MAG: amidohydrolase family protein [Candidatus Helarchaeota archaeon]|nr:amidohydrolase family protein [Candidatus Helarchaeota archaeon]